MPMPTPMRPGPIVLLLLTLLLAGCLHPAPPPTTPPPTPPVGQEPTVSPWRTGTPVPLFAPLTGECLAEQVREAGESAEAASAAEARSSPSLPRLHYGINAFLLGTDSERVLTLTGIAGFGWVRQQIHWRDLEGKRGQLVWTPLDQVVSAARSHDLRIMLSVVRSPAWATSTGHSGLPDDPTTLATFLRQLATRYRGRVSAYEIWNEPNLSHESGGAPGDPATYLATLQAAYPAIKEADPCALVLAAPLAATNQPDPAVATDDLPFYEALYALDEGAFLHVADVVAVHPGAGPHPPGARWPADAPQQSHHYFRHIERVHDLMRQHGDTRPVWITEVGWNTSPAEGAPEPVSEEEQSRYLVDTLWMVRQSYPWVGGVFVWNLNFSVITEPGDEKAGFSILNPDWSIRPAYLTLQMNVNALQDIERPPLLSAGAAAAYAWTFPGRGPMRSPPLLAPDGTIYAISDPGTLYAITPAGTLQWAYHASGMVSSTPARAPDGTLYLGDSSSLLTALHPDGRVAWTVRLRSPLRGSPVFHDGHLYGVTSVGEVVAFDEEGQEVWTRDLESETTPLALSSDGLLLVGTAAGSILKMGTDGEVPWNTELEQELWPPLTPDRSGGVVVATVDGDVVVLDRRGSVVTTDRVGVPIEAAPLIGQDDPRAVFVAARDGVLHALGTQPWQVPTGSDLRGPPVQSEAGILYLGTEDERLLALDGRGHLLWQAHLRGAIHAPPVLGADGKMLYVATMSGRLYAFSLGR